MQLLLLVVVPVAGNGILGLVDHILHHVGLGIGIATIPILLTAEGQDQLENEGQQQKADTEADALIEGLGPVDVHLDDEIDVVDGDQQQKELPAVAVQLLTQHLGVVEGDDALPALTAHLLEDHPLRHQRQDTDNQFQNHTILSPFVFLQSAQNTRTSLPRVYQIFCKNQPIS